MKVVVAFYLATTLTLAADDASMVNRITVFWEAATKASKNGEFPLAEEKLNAALKECAALPDSQFHLKTGLLGDLAELYSKEKQVDKAASAYKLRLDTLISHHKDGEAPDLDIGNALF